MTQKTNEIVPMLLDFYENLKKEFPNLERLTFEIADFNRLDEFLMWGFYYIEGFKTCQYNSFDELYKIIITQKGKRRLFRRGLLLQKFKI